MKRKLNVSQLRWEKNYILTNMLGMLQIKVPND